MSEKFTKGSWSRDKYGNLLDSSGANIMFRGVTILGSGGPEKIEEAEANTSLAAAAPDLYAAAKAAIAYDEAIQQSANDPAAMSGFCTATGDTLDTLYEDWISKSRAALSKANTA